MVLLAESGSAKGRVSSLLVLALVFLPSLAGAQEEIFSGPQAGEKIQEFNAKHLRGESAGDELVVFQKDQDKPVLVIFWHELDRPGFALIRGLADYCQAKKEKLRSVIVALDDDPEAPRFKRTLQYLPASQLVVVSADGSEGPGSYGLNRNVRLTVLVGKDGKVTDNFALVQPSLQADGPKILKAMAGLIGEKAPDVAELENASSGRMNARGRMRGQRANSGSESGQLAGLLRRVIDKQASGKDVESAIAAVEKLVQEDAEARQDLGARASRIVNAGKLENYGTKAAQEAIEKWAKKYGTSTKDR